MPESKPNGSGKGVTNEVNEDILRQVQDLQKKLAELELEIKDLALEYRRLRQANGNSALQPRIPSGHSTDAFVPSGGSPVPSTIDIEMICRSVREQLVEELAVAAFTNGIGNEIIGNVLRQQQPKTLDEAVKIAVMAEKIEEEIRWTMRSGRAFPTYSPSARRYGRRSNHNAPPCKN